MSQTIERPLLLRIVGALSSLGEASAPKIGERLNENADKVGTVLRRLEARRLVERRSDGKGSNGRTVSFALTDLGESYRIGVLCALAGIQEEPKKNDPRANGGRSIGSAVDSMAAR